MNPLFFLSFFAIACASGDKTKTSATENTPKKNETASTTSEPNQNQSKSQVPENSPTGQPKAYDPLAGKALADICNSNGLALIKWPYDKLSSDFKGLCCVKGGLDDERCEMDWPSSDILSCGEYDEMRNEIYAHYGRRFQSKRWQQTFGKQAWYKVRDDYSDSWVSKIAMANVSQLKKMKKNKHNCMD